MRSFWDAKRGPKSIKKVIKNRYIFGSDFGRVLDLLGSSWEARNVVLLKGFDGVRKIHFSPKNQILERKSEILGPDKETKSDKKTDQKIDHFSDAIF